MVVFARQKVRFGPFELDSQTGELSKQSQRINLHGQPIEVLALLLEHSGELVSREDIRHRLWPQDTFVDFEHSLNTAIKKLRQALDDNAETPRYIETLPRKGYRFIAPVESVPSAADPVAAKTEEASERAAALQTPEPPAPHLWKYAVATVVVLAATAAAAWYWFLRPRTPVVTSIHQLTQTGRHKSIWMFHQPETDGTRVYFDEFSEGKWHIAQVSALGGEVSYIETPLIQQPFIQDILHDGSQLLVADSNCASPDDSIWVVPLPYGPARRIPGTFSGMMFLPGSDRIVYTHSSDKRLFTAKLDGSEARPLMPFPGEIGFYLRGQTGPSFAISPDGERTRFTAADGKIWESHLDGTGMHRFLPEHEEPMCCGRWSADGQLYVFARLDRGGYSLWATSESGWSRYPSASRPVRLTHGPIQFQFSTPSKDGKQIFALGKTLLGELNVYDAKAGAFRSYFNGISAGFLDFSRDGQWVTYVSHSQGDLWRSRIDGSERLQLTFPPTGPILNPKWSPDGRFIAFTEWGDLNRKIYLVSVDGGAPMLLLGGDFQPTDPTWSPDGKSIAYGGASTVGATRGSVRTEIRIMNLDTKESRTVPGSQGLYSPRWSPDGTHIAALSEDQEVLFLYSFDTSRWKQLPLPKLPRSGAIGWPAWSHDGCNLYIMRDDLNIYKVRISDGKAEVAVSAAGIDIIVPVFPWGVWFELTPDDRVIVLRDRGTDEIYAIDVEYR